MVSDSAIPFLALGRPSGRDSMNEEKEKKPKEFDMIPVTPETKLLVKDFRNLLAVHKKQDQTFDTTIAFLLELGFKKLRSWSDATIGTSGTR